MKKNKLLRKWRGVLARTALLWAMLLSGLISFGHGVQLRWNIVPTTGAIRVWVEHWHGNAHNVNGFPLVVSYTVNGSTTQQTYYATGYVNNATVAQLPDGGSTSTLLSYCSGRANNERNWVYWDFNPPACNTPVTLNIIEGTAATTTEGCSNLYPQTIYSSFNDNTGPAITANDITVAPTDTTDCSALVNSFGVTAVDACGGAVTTTYSIAEGTVFAQGTTAVTVTSTDQYGNVSTKTFNVTVGDVQAPVVVTQDLTVTLVNGVANVTASQIENGSYDNACGGIASYALDQTSFGCSNVGANTVTLSVTDIFGNVGTGTATVTVLSDLAVTATPSDALCYGSCDGSVALNITGGHAPYTIVTDELNHTFDGNSIDNSLFTYTGSYTQNGVLNTVYQGNSWDNYFRTSATMDRVAGKSFEFSWYIGSTSDNMIGWYGTNSTGSYYEYQNMVHSLYTYSTSNYMYIYEDGSNYYSFYLPTNNEWYDFKIELLANGANYYYKQSSASSYTLIYTSSNSSETDLSPGMTYYGSSSYGAQTDNWVVSGGGAGTSSDTTNLCAGSYTMTIQDASGCKADVSFTINEPSAPIASSVVPNDSACINEPFSVSAGTTTGGTAPYTYSWDMGDGNMVSGATANHVYTSFGSMDIVMTVTDANGCTWMDSTSTYVKQCNVAPVAVCQNITVYTNMNCMGEAVATDIDGGSTDANGDTMSFNMVPAGPFTVGTHPVTLFVSDPMGATDSCTALITVTDNTAPNALAQDATVYLDAAGNGAITVADINNGSSDACGVAVMTLSNYNYTCANVGTNMVWLTVTDVNGNSSVDSAMVTVVDTVAPMASAMNYSLQLNASGLGTFGVSDINNGSSDACGIASMVLSDTMFSCESIGANNVTLTVTDVNGNVSSATVIVTVEDNVLPLAVAQGMTIQLDSTGNASITAADIDNGSSDACGIANLALDVSSFNCESVGPNTVTLSVTDNNGNVSTSSVVVNVEDNIAPVVVTNDITVQLDSAGMASITPGDIDNGSNDACGIASMTLDTMNFSCANVGANTVTLTVTDNNGNVSTQTATVTVEDNVAPIAIGQDVIVQLDAQGMGSITTAEIDNGSNDACGIASLSLDTSNFSCANVGPNMVVLTVVDNNGNSSSDTIIVMIEDNVNPVTIGQDITVQLDSTGMVSITPADVDNGSNDACGIALLQIDNDMFDCNDVGMNTVVLVSTDMNGNISTDTVTVTVEDNVAPVAMCQNVSVTLLGGMASITPADMDNGSYDACGIASMTISDSAWTCDDIGDHEVTLTVTDVNGNVSTCTATVTVVGEIPSLIVASHPTCDIYTGGDSNIIYLGYGPQTTVLSTMATGGSNFTYSWTGTGLDSLNSATPTFTPTEQGYYTFTCEITNEYGCIITSSITICVLDIRVPCKDKYKDKYYGYSKYGKSHGHYGKYSCKHTCKYGHYKGKGHKKNHKCHHSCQAQPEEPVITCIPEVHSCQHTCSKGHGHGYKHGYKKGCKHRCDTYYNWGNADKKCTKVYLCYTPSVKHCKGHGDDDDDDDDDDDNDDNDTEHHKKGSKYKYKAKYVPKSKTIKVYAKDVAKYLAKYPNSKLGACDVSCDDFTTSGKKADDENTVTEQFGEFTVDVSLYPNPTISNFTVFVESEMEETVTVQVFDLAGNLMERVEGQFTYSEIEMGQNLAAGVYLVVIEQGDYKTTIRAVKGN